MGKQFLDALSVCLWTLTAGGRVLGERLRRGVVAVTRALTAVVLALTRPPARGGAVLRLRPLARRAAIVAAGTAVIVTGAGLAAGPSVRLAAAPVSRSLASRGLPLLEQRSTVVAAGGDQLAVVHDGVNRHVVGLDEIPEIMRQAVVAAEDRRYWDHGGYDTEAVARAAVANLRARGVTQGASTISQQLAKANFVGDAPTVARKAKELVYAVALERRFTKSQLLERYLNQVYFGTGAYGVAAAAEEYFGARAQDLSAGQSALLAGLIRAPVASDPRRDPGAATARRNEVLAAMANEGYLPPAGAAAASRAPLGVVPYRSQQPTAPFVVEAVKREFLANPAFGPTEQDRRRLLLTGGLEIRTTLNPVMQAAARAAADDVPGRLGSAIVAVDPSSGAIVALHDGGAAGSGHFDVATQGRRQPGSTFKPLAAVAALEEGMPDWQRLVGTGPIELDYPEGDAPWRVRNFADSSYGDVVLRDAVVNSVNTAFAQLGVALGPDRIADVAQRLGIDVDGALGPPAARGPSIALGGLTHGVSPLELASAYSTFAAGGARVTPHLIDRVLGPDGRELYRASPARQAVLDGAVNAEVVDILQDAVAYGTGSAAALPGWHPLGKTGTSEGSADAWFVGAVPVLAAAVWVGDPGGERPVAGLSGGADAAPVWRDFMAAALDAVTPVDFPGPARSRTGMRPIKLPVPRACAMPCTDGA